VKRQNLLLLAFCLASLALPQGTERWSIKTSVAKGSKLSHPKFVPLKDLLQFANPPDVKAHDKRYQDARIPAFENPAGLKEGDMVATEGYLVLVALDKGDDDYHIQIRENPTTAAATDCMIVEVPLGAETHVKSKSLRSKFQMLRQWLRDELKPSSGEFSSNGSVMQHPTYVRVSGQLFFDFSHHPHPEARGKKGMKAVTSWELHPVYKIAFVPPPAG
jgi:hypothetical protein